MRFFRCLCTALLIVPGCTREPPGATVLAPLAPAPVDPLWRVAPQPPLPAPVHSAPSQATPFPTVPEPSASPPTPAPSAPVPAAPTGACSAADCTSCTGKPGCAWCGHPRGCLPSSERTSCPGSNYWIDRPVWCGAVNGRAGVSGLAPVEAPRFDRLETVNGLQWRVRRGLCYELLIKLAPGAKLDRSVLYARMHDTVQDIGAPVVLVFGATPPVFGEPACPRSSGTLTLSVKDTFDNFTSPIRGRGAFEAQLFARPIAESELVAREKVEDERYRRGMCKGCRQDYAACFFRGDTGCDAALAECLRGGGIPWDQCR